MTAAEVFVIYAPLGAFICSGGLLLMIREPKMPKWVDVAASIMLLLFAALFLGMLQSIFDGLPNETPLQKDMRTKYQIALYLVPFFTAGLATNILSNVILAKRDYDGSMPFWVVVLKLLWAMVLMLLTLSVFGLMIYAAWKKWWEKPSAAVNRGLKDSAGTASMVSKGGVTSPAAASKAGRKRK